MIAVALKGSWDGGPRLPDRLRRRARRGDGQRHVHPHGHHLEGVRPDLQRHVREDLGRHLRQGDRQRPRRAGCDDPRLAPRAGSRDRRYRCGGRRDLRPRLELQLYEARRPGRRHRRWRCTDPRLRNRHFRAAVQSAEPRRRASGRPANRSSSTKGLPASTISMSETRSACPRGDAWSSSGSPASRSSAWSTRSAARRSRCSTSRPPSGCWARKGSSTTSPSRPRPASRRLRSRRRSGRSRPPRLRRDRSRASTGEREGDEDLHEVHPALPARVRRGSRCSWCVRHLQHSLDHGRSANAEFATSRALGVRHGARSSAPCSSRGS